MTSLCDKCARPGSCCSGFVLAAGALANGTPAQVDALLAEAVTCSDVQNASAHGGSVLYGHGPADYIRARADARVADVRFGLPFKPLYQAPDGRWHYWCPNLDRSGRCGDYANRPIACHALRPGEGRACCHHVPGIGTCADRAIDQFRRPAQRETPGAAAGGTPAKKELLF